MRPVAAVPIECPLVAGGSLGFTALADWACVCSVQRCSETTQFN